ncbi:hypothetical protein Nepgr_025581 [Nepenthes gracilis]|uniref:Uncharacterized protein n=1 Tax=Nepenthes gracilis TaxID=150966 RepID=A0AAD3T6K8_NEPGR|nr:hypothetical protein Nepgr_025581 [Nepenthes gracilis]
MADRGGDAVAVWGCNSIAIVLVLGLSMAKMSNFKQKRKEEHLDAYDCAALSGIFSDTPIPEILKSVGIRRATLALESHAQLQSMRKSRANDPWPVAPVLLSCLLRRRTPLRLGEEVNF